MDKTIEMRYSVDIKKMFLEESTLPKDFNNFNAERLSKTPDLSTDVIIVGAGPTGLSSALLLQQFGIKVIVLNKYKIISTHPKARAISCRSMELLRKLGIQKELEKYNIPDLLNWFGWFSTLTGKLHGRIVKRTIFAKISPTDEAVIAQQYLEETMLKAFQERGGQVLFQHRLIDFAQNNEIVQAKIENNKKEELVLQAKYMIAADGVNSTIQKLLQIPMIGPAVINFVLSIYCEINMDHILEKDNRCGIAMVPHKDGTTMPTVISVDGKHKWIFGFSLGSSIELKELYTDEYAKSKIQDVIGCADNLQIHIIDKKVWSIGSQVPNQIVAGRTFFAGDSAHRISPIGGMGMNTGFQDVDNLAWKIAYVILGKATPNILLSYPEERVPVILNNVEWAVLNMQLFIKLLKDIAEKGMDAVDFEAHTKKQDALLNKSGLDLGIIYKSNIIATTSDIKPVISADQYIPNTYPGSRLPHFQLIQNGAIISSLDLISTEFLLLCLEPGNNYASAIDFKSISTKTVCLSNNSSINEVNCGEFLSLLKLNEFAGVWVRPDGHIAWKGSLNQSSDLDELKRIINLMAVTH